MKRSTYSIQAGKFKAKCLQLMDEVEEKHIIITITKHGKPVAQLTPIDLIPVSAFGCLKNSVTVVDEIISPIDIKWESN